MQYRKYKYVYTLRVRLRVGSPLAPGTREARGGPRARPLTADVTDVEFRLCVDVDR